MADWAAALAQGIGAAATTGAGIIGDQIKQQQALDAEQRAADIKLDLHQRMAAADEMMKNRAAERFSMVVKQKMGEEVPLEAQGVDKTGITREAGQAAGSIDVDGTQVAGSFNADPATLRQMLQNANRRLMDPASSDEERTQARELVAVLQKQVDAQAGINAKDVEGKTRKRTTDEAGQAALDDTLQNDAPAFIAGTGMLAAAQKQDLAEQTLKMREASIAERLQASKDRTDMMGEIARIRLEAAQAAGSKDGKLPADAKMIEYLVEHGMDHKTASDRVLGTGAGATKDPVALASSLASSLITNGAVRVTKDDPAGTTVASKAMTMAIGQIDSAQQKFRASTPMSSPAAGGKGAATTPANDPLGLFSK